MPVSQPEVVGRPEVVTDEDTEVEQGPLAHIVKVPPGQSAAEVILQARVEGTPVEALCGYVWVPSRDPRQLPVCQQCRDIFEMYQQFNDGLNEPGDA
jgi:hypothetical protein